jgi:hypothetical protein
MRRRGRAEDEQAPSRNLLGLVFVNSIEPSDDARRQDKPGMITGCRDG